MTDVVLLDFYYNNSGTVYTLHVADYVFRATTSYTLKVGCYPSLTIVTKWTGLPVTAKPSAGLKIMPPTIAID